MDLEQGALLIDRQIGSKQIVLIYHRNGDISTAF